MIMATLCGRLTGDRVAGSRPGGKDRKTKLATDQGSGSGYTVSPKTRKATSSIATHHETAAASKSKVHRQFNVCMCLHVCTKHSFLVQSQWNFPLCFFPPSCCLDVFFLPRAVWMCGKFNPFYNPWLYIGFNRLIKLLLASLANCILYILYVCALFWRTV